MTSCLFAAHRSPAGKGSTLKGKNLLQRRERHLSEGKQKKNLIDIFQKGDKKKSDRVISPESISKSSNKIPSPMLRNKQHKKISITHYHLSLFLYCMLSNMLWM